MPEIFSVPSQAENVYPIAERWGQHPWEGPYGGRIPTCMTTLPPSSPCRSQTKNVYPFCLRPASFSPAPRPFGTRFPKSISPWRRSFIPLGQVSFAYPCQGRRGGCPLSPHPPSAMTPAYAHCDRRRGGQTSLARANYRAYTQSLLRPGKTLSPPSIFATNTQVYLDGGDSSSGATYPSHTHTLNAPESSLCPPISARIPTNPPRAKTFDLGLSPVLARIPKKHAREAQ